MAEEEKESEASKPIAEISHEPSKFEEALNKHFKLLVLLMVLIAVGVAAWVVNRHIGDENQRAAGAALVAANEIDELQALRKSYPETPSFVTAAVKMSDLQWEEGKQAASLDTLRAAIGGDPDHPSVASARARLGARLLMQGELSGAAEQFEVLVDTPKARYLAPYAETMLAEIQIQRENKEGATERLEEATQAYAGSPFMQMLNQQRQLVSFTMPEEVAPPVEDESTDNESLDLLNGENMAPGFDPAANNPLLKDLENNPNSSLEGLENPSDTAEETEESSPSVEDSAESESKSPDHDPAAESGE